MEVLLFLLVVCFWGRGIFDSLRSKVEHRVFPASWTESPWGLIRDFEIQQNKLMAQHTQFWPPSTDYSQIVHLKVIGKQTYIYIYMIMSWGGYWQFNSAGFRWASLTSLVWSQAIPAVVWKRFSTWAVVVHHGLDRPDTAPDSWIRGWCEIYVRFMWFDGPQNPPKKTTK